MNKKLEPSPKHPTSPPDPGPITGPSPLPPKVRERKRGKRVRIREDGQAWLLLIAGVLLIILPCLFFAALAVGLGR